MLKMKIKIYKTFGRNPNIGWWAQLAFGIVIARAADFFRGVPVYSVTIGLLLWQIEINNNKSY